MDVRNFFDSFKDFFWDILGYFLPGLYLMLILSSCVLPDRFYSSEIINVNPSLNVFILVVISYLLGYFIYGVGVLKDKILKKISSTKRIEKKAQDNIEFKISKDRIRKYLKENEIPIEISENIETRKLRNLVMPFVPEVDNKTYTFMFRSDLCKHLGNTSLIVGSLGFLNILINWLFGSLSVFRVEANSVILYTILLGSYFIFRETRNYFYSIALKIPFSAYIVIKGKKKEDGKG